MKIENRQKKTVKKTLLFLWMKMAWNFYWTKSKISYNSA